MKRKEHFLLWTCSILLGSAFSSSSSSSSLSVGNTETSGGDKFVSASPLAIAAVCSNGVAIVAVHTSMSAEPLLLPEDQENNEQENEESNEIVLSDLPLSCRGPLRIEQIDDCGTAMVCAGWRTDCAALAEKVRSLSSTEVSKYGISSATKSMDYGRYLADATFQYMAQCSVSDNVRALSSVALLASISTTAATTKTGAKGEISTICPSFLWLVDATGSYRVRAHAIGHGASKINAKLVTIDFSIQTAKEGAQTLVQLISSILSPSVNDEKVGDGDDDSDNDAALPPRSRVEIAILNSNQQQQPKSMLMMRDAPTFQRLRQPFTTTTAGSL